MTELVDRAEVTVAVAALNEHDMVLWDYWRLADREHLTVDQRDLLDRAARIMVDGEVTVDDPQDLHAHDGFRVPSIVTSYSPAADAPMSVSVAR